MSAPDHLAAQLALRARLLTLSVATTGSVNLSATAGGYARAAGSFIADGFAIGLEVAPSGFVQTAVGVVTSVTALALGIAGGRTVEAAGAGKSIVARLPALRAWDNIPVTPVAGQPYIEEEYVPATSTLRTFPALGGSIEDTGLYVVRWYAPQSTGVAALRKPASAILSLFAPGTAVAVGAGAIRVQGNPGPKAGAILSDGGGWSVVTITIPWWWDNINS